MFLVLQFLQVQDAGSEEGLALFVESLQRDCSVVSSLASSSQRYKEGWSRVMDVLEQCQGCIFTSGIGIYSPLNSSPLSSRMVVGTILFIVGKSGMVAERLAASLSSIGVHSAFVHAAEWLHGDLGMSQP